MRRTSRFILAASLAATICSAAADTNIAQAVTGTGANAAPARGEQIRAECIQNRRTVCGRVMQLTPDGLVVDSGYTSLLRPPLDHSWLTRANVNPPKTPNLVEGSAPDAVAVGMVVLTDFPKRPKVSQYDYVCLHAYPAGYVTNKPMPGIEKKLRRFAGGLETAVRLNLQASEH